MDAQLPMTGTARLLTLLDPYIPDSFINDHWPRHPGRGRRARLSAAQLWRVHLLSVLTPTHAFNLLLELLAEHRAWRQFAHLANRQQAPDVWMLHQFRERLGVSGLRQINDHILQPLLPPPHPENLSLALIDATDLPAACSGHKKRAPATIRPWERP